MKSPLHTQGLCTLALLVAIPSFSALHAATLTVTTASDVVSPGDGVLSLREAINDAQSGDTIDFDAALAGTPLVLTGGSLTIETDLTIEGLGADELVIDGNQNGRVFFIDGFGTDVAMSGLTITGGNVGGDGGAIRHDGGALVVTDCVLRGNTASSMGGAIAHFFGFELEVTRCALEDNSAAIGGGIFINFGETTVTDTSIGDNTGGGIWNLAGSLLVERSSITGNVVDSNDGGSGILNSGGTLQVVNSTISDNTSTGAFGGVGSGGGLRAGGGEIEIYSSTIVDNSAVTSGGGIAVTSAFASVEITHSIVAGNDAPVGADCTDSVEIVSTGHNLVGDGTSCPTDGTGDQVVDSASLFVDVLGGLGQSTGSTETHPLLANSSALDAGDLAGCLDPDGALLTDDQRGGARPFGSACDIGAFERDPNALLLSIGGSCPGSVTISVIGGSAGSNLAIAGSASAGSSSVPSGPCAGTELELDSPALRTVLTADDDGFVSITRDLPEPVCGTLLQAIDVESCATSNLSSLD